MLYTIFPQKAHKQRHSINVRVELLVFYLLSKERKIPAQQISGSPDILADIIKNCGYAEPFTSLVLSFTELLSIEQCRRIIREYEAVAYAGIDPRDIYRIWVLHQDHGRTELHCVVANVHLGMKKGWKHYYHRSDKKLFHNWQELTNLKYGYTSPDEPAREQLKAPQSKQDLSVEEEELIEKIDHKVIEGVMSGDLATQLEIVDFINDLGFKAKGTKKYVSVRKPGFEKERPLRLTGPKYRGDFQSAAYFAERLAKRQTSSPTREELEREVQAGLLIRRCRMRDRYSKKSSNAKKKEKENERRTNKKSNPHGDRTTRKSSDPGRGKRPQDNGRARRHRQFDLISIGQSLKRKLIRLGLRIINGDLCKDQKTLVSKTRSIGELSPINRQHLSRRIPVWEPSSKSPADDQSAAIQPKKENGSTGISSPSEESQNAANDLDRG